MGSGGGGTTTQVANSGIADQFAPYVERVLSDVTDMYEADRLKGADAVVADLTQEQKDALTAQKGYAQDMMAGTGIFGVTLESPTGAAHGISDLKIKCEQYYDENDTTTPTSQIRWKTNVLNFKRDQVLDQVCCGNLMEFFLNR